MYNLKYAEIRVENDNNLFTQTLTEMDSAIFLENQYRNNRIRVDKFDDLAYFQLDIDGLYFNKYKRVYKKIPDVLAEVFGIMQPVILIFSILVKFLTKYFIDNFMVNNFICYFTKEKNKYDKLLWNDKTFKNFKNHFKDLKFNYHEMTEIENVKKISNDDNEAKSNKIISHSEFPRRKTKSEISEGIQIEEIKKKIEPDKAQITLNDNDIINEINIELFDKNQKDKNNDKNPEKIEKKSLIINQNVDLKYKNEDVKKRFNFFNSMKGNQNNFPFIGFFDYYFPCLAKKKTDLNHNIDIRKIFKHFSKEILHKLDLLYYLKLVRTIELLKNIELRSKVEKESIQFLIKNLYFVRDCDLESISNEIGNLKI